MKGMGSPLIDGTVLGTQLMTEGARLGVELGSAEYQYLSTVFLEHLGGTAGRSAIHADIQRNEINLHLTCQLWKDRYWLNVEGNPISFLTGQNLVGTIELDKLVKNLYSAIEQTVCNSYSQFVMPSSVVTAVAKLDVYINRLAVACYSEPLGLTLEQQEHLFALLYQIYPTVYKGSENILDWVGSMSGKNVKIIVQKDGTHSVRFECRRNGNKQWSLALYNKHQEQAAQGGQVLWLADRVRLDLTLFSDYFNKNKINRLSTFHDRYGSNYRQWSIRLLRDLLTVLKLPYLLTFDLGVDVKQHNQWLTKYLAGTAPKPDANCKSELLHAGLDVSVPAQVHTAVALSRIVYDVDKLKVDLRRKTVTLSTTPSPKLKRLQRAAAHLVPDTDFPVVALYTADAPH